MKRISLTQGKVSNATRDPCASVTAEEAGLIDLEIRGNKQLMNQIVRK